MNIDQQGRRYFWPILFISAFALGALLWGFWMYQVVVKTRRQQPDSYYKPGTNQPTATNAPGPANNSPGM